MGGGDLTKGSCSSLALAYAGNRGDLDVLDFRGGESRSIFSQRSTIMLIAKNTNGKIVEEYSDYTATNKLLKEVSKDKEYYLACGSHAAIVRKTDIGLEYLELQSAKNNGFKPLNTRALKRRFGAKKSRTHYREKYKTKSFLIDVEELNKNKAFKKVLGYINTQSIVQKRGKNGRIK